MSGRSFGNWTHTLSLWCLNPAVVFSDIASLSLSVILTSGYVPWPKLMHIQAIVLYVFFSFAHKCLRLNKFYAMVKPPMQPVFCCVVPKESTSADTHIYLNVSMYVSIYTIPRIWTSYCKAAGSSFPCIFLPNSIRNFSTKYSHIHWF